jgi:hypothetical protein
MESTRLGVRAGCSLGLPRRPIVGRLIAIAFALAFTHGLWAEHRLNVSAYHDGQLASGYEVCFYPFVGGDPADTLSAKEFRCLPGNKKIAFPPSSSFAIFARHSSGLISRNPMFLTSRPDGDGFQRLGFELVEAGMVDTTLVAKGLAPNEHISLVIVGSADNAPFVMPASERIILVPPNVRIIPVLSRDGSPVAFAESVSVRAGESVAVTPFTPTNALLVRVALADPLTGSVPDLRSCSTKYHAEAVSILVDQEPPSITLLDSTGKTHMPVAGVAKIGQLPGALLIFRGFEPGPAVLKLSGGRWQEAKRSIDVSPGVSRVEKPLTALLGGDLQVLVDHPLVDVLAGASRKCDTTSEQHQKPQPKLTLSRCASDEGTMQVPVAGCEDLSSIAVDEAPSLFNGLQPGAYRVVAQVGAVVVGEARSTVTVGKTTRVILAEPTVPFVHGFVSMEGQPVVGYVNIAGETTNTAKDGYYAAILSPGTISESNARAVVYVWSCDETTYYGYWPKSAVVPGTMLNIEIPAGEVAVTVRDSATKDALSNAFVSLARIPDIEHPDDAMYTIPARYVADSYLVKNIAKGDLYRVCAESRGYERRCSDKVQTKGERIDRITLDLESIDERTGRVLAGGYSHIFWTTRAGAVTEAASIEPDGTFRYRQDHGPEEVVVLVGEAPLYVARSTSHDDGGNLTIPIATASKHDISVRLADRSRRNKAMLGLWVDGVFIAPRALRMHQIRRRQPMFVGKSTPGVKLLDIAGDSIMIVAGPDPDLVPPGTDLSAPSAFQGTEPQKPVNGEVSLN